MCILKQRDLPILYFENESKSYAIYYPLDHKWYRTRILHIYTRVSKIITNVILPNGNVWPKFSSSDPYKNQHRHWVYLHFDSTNFRSTITDFDIYNAYIGSYILYKSYMKSLHWTMQTLDLSIETLLFKARLTLLILIMYTCIYTS